MLKNKRARKTKKVSGALKKLSLETKEHVDYMQGDDQKNNNTDISKNIVNVLNGYNYFLNNTQTKYVSVGFSTVDFSPIVKISVHNSNMSPDYVIFDQKHWTIFHANKELLEERMKMDTMHEGNHNFFYKGELDNFLEVTFMDFNDSTCLLLTQNNTSTLLRNSEFSRLMDLADFITSTLIYNSSVQYFVREYCERYWANCESMGVKKLNASMYIAPTEIRPPINYYRLFHEIPLLYDLFCAEE